jgi:hypothetical protein
LVEVLLDQAHRVKKESVDMLCGDRDHGFVHATCGQ